jgi:hypothetical protein
MDDEAGEDLGRRRAIAPFLSYNKQTNGKQYLKRT